MELTLNEPQFNSRNELISIANKHLPVLKAFDNDLHQELLGIGKTSNRSAAEIIVLNPTQTYVTLTPC